MLQLPRISLLFVFLFVVSAQDEESRPPSLTEPPAMAAANTPTAPSVAPVPAAPSTGNPTITPAPTSLSPTGPECSLCPDGSSVGNPGKILFFLASRPNCGATQEFLSQSASAEKCEQNKAAISTYPITVESWCECPNTEPINMCDPMCEEGSFIVNPAQPVAVARNALTCGFAETVVPYIEFQPLCFEFILVRNQCCSQPGETPFPTVTPPVQPGSDPSSAGGRTSASSIFGLAMLAVAMFLYC